MKISGRNCGMKISASEPIRFRGIFYKNSLSMGECSQFGKKWTVNFLRGYIPELPYIRTSTK